MRLFDLHCDTLYKATAEHSSLNDNDNHISVDKAHFLEKYKQMCAIWIPDTLKGKSATDLFLRATKIFKSERFNDDKINMYLAVENASMLAGNIHNVDLLISNDVKYVTLTWNGENELGSGAMCNSDTGITTFGRDVVRTLQEKNISVDLSHASDGLFYDVIDITQKPVIATHSNSRVITDVKRNLTDDQFKIIRDLKGIVGLNFYKGFLNINENNACIDNILRHAEHFLNLGGEDTLCIGADFDGADMPHDIKGIETMSSIYEQFSRFFGANVTKKVFYDNANMYFTNFDNKA